VREQIFSGIVQEGWPGRCRICPDKLRCVSPILSLPAHPGGKELAPAFAKSHRAVRPANRLLWLHRACPSATLD